MRVTGAAIFRSSSPVVHAHMFMFVYCTCTHVDEQALEQLSMKAANIPNDGGEASPSWLTLLSGLPCFAVIRPRLGEMLRCALGVETDVALVTHYLVHLRQSAQVPTCMPCLFPAISNRIHMYTHKCTT
jgi:hypothetical protein